MPKCTLSMTVQGLEIKTPFNREFVDDLKDTIPARDRSFRGQDKAWIVNPRHGAKVVMLINRYFGEVLSLPQVANVSSAVERELIILKYLGTPKEIPGQRELMSNGAQYGSGDWVYLFPQSVLKEYFERHGQGTSLYSLLGVDLHSTPEEIKAGYKRMVKQWHPDVCKEPDAHEMFIRIKEAYDSLNDPNKRKLYNIGLEMETRRKDLLEDRGVNTNMFRPSLRTGRLVIDGRWHSGKLIVSKIYAWEDIVNASGQSLVVSYDPMKKELVEEWR